MKTIASLVTTACLAALTVTSLSAMEQPNPAPTHRLVGVIKPQQACDMITFVKKISDRHLAVVDRKGRGEIFDLMDNYKSIHTLSFDNGFLNDIFTYRDKNGEDLFIAFDGDLHVCKPSKTCKISENCCVRFEQKATVALSMVQPSPLNIPAQQLDNNSIGKADECPICVENYNDILVRIITPCKHNLCLSCLYTTVHKNRNAGCPFCRSPITVQNLIDIGCIKLVMISTDNNSAFPIDLTWAVLNDEYRPRYVDLFSINPIKNFYLNDVINEGLVINSQNYNKFRLSNDIFNIISLTQEQRSMTINDEWYKKIPRQTLKSIKCYHKTLDGVLYLGHDGFISIWKPE